ncbi:MAG: phosphatidylserine decarboxylase family protein [Flavobacteriales bacterium]|nr:phosphatidylserine decarboxylase family protein [Flavobacteriales bacterium]MCB9448824.1 phosphatidylserine decarboxylase family protein [Flavobacteriales bacterium]
MKLHREGKATIFIATMACALLVFVFHRFLPEFLSVPLSVAAVIVLLIILYFFRVPDRASKPDDALVLSPCDGKVVVIEEVEEPEYFKGKRIQISVFMSPLNVHINWYPISGTVSYTKYHPGKYLVAWHPKSSTENERTTIVVKHANGGEILFRQIAGALARRIVYYAKENAKATQGEEMGFIKFGSRLDILVPVDADIKVKLGDVVKGKQSPLAAWTGRG